MSTTSESAAQASQGVGSFACCSDGSLVGGVVGAWGSGCTGTLKKKLLVWMVMGGRRAFGSVGFQVYVGFRFRTWRVINNFGCSSRLLRKTGFEDDRGFTNTDNPQCYTVRFTLLQNPCSPKPANP